MASNRFWTRTAATRQRLLLVIAAIAVVTAWRERSFNRNRARFGTPTAGS